MSFLGANTNGLGLGRNLITNESLSLDLNINEVIDANKRKILELWSFPKIDQGFSISIDQLKIFFGNRYINFPALIVLNSSNKVDQIMFDFYYANNSVSNFRECEMLFKDCNALNVRFP